MTKPSWNAFFSNAIGLESNDIDESHVLLITRANELLLTCKKETDSTKLHEGKDYQHCPICGMGFKQ